MGKKGLKRDHLTHKNIKVLFNINRLNARLKTLGSANSCISLHGGFVAIERFVTFLPNQGHKAEDMFNGLKEFLNLHDIEIKNCRGQSYDNASAMSGRYNKLQALVNKEN